MLLDTCTVAEIRKPKPDPTVVATLTGLPDESLFLSVITVGEITKGVVLLAAGRRRNELSAWLAALEARFHGRVLTIDAETARTWGELTARARKEGVVVPTTDGLIAATALRHGLHVMTRNEKDFKNSGVRVVNPWRPG